ncbi:AzlC family ABC transporter permease [Litoribrevibacter albus]|uniref:Transporter n=1 Tax=Litoribrevibacter albus TaxID=1473156 RepID=A0AA37S950_9GAMM|nr:AzlC family ABC transporter permease [Litoribrevibacter albus]GLQ30861.1 transporter [Litoribrevibacter albus]
MNTETATLPLATDALTGELSSSSTVGKFNKREFIRGLIAAIPVMIGFVPVALVLGAQASAKGLNLFEVPLMTGLNFGGGSEFTAMGLWTSPPHILLIVTMSMLVNSRHILMGAALAPYLKHLSKKQAIPSLFFMCDESWAMALADAKKKGAAHISLPYYLGTAIGLYLTWVTFTTLGVWLGPTLGNLDQFGFDMAFTAVFLVLLKGMWKGTTACRPWLVSLVFAALTYLLIPGAWYVAAGALSGLLYAAYQAGEAENQSIEESPSSTAGNVQGGHPQ